MTVHIRKFELGSVAFHKLYVLGSWGTKNLDDLDYLVHGTVTWEDWLSQKNFGNNATFFILINGRFCIFVIEILISIKNKII